MWIISKLFKRKARFTTEAVGNLQSSQRPHISRSSEQPVKCTAENLSQQTTGNEAPMRMGAANSPIVNWDYNKKLMAAAYTGDNSGVTQAIQDGADVNFTDTRNPGSPAPLLAALEGYQSHDKSSILNVMKTLLEHGANPNVNNGFNNALKIASGRGHLDVVKLLLAFGADPTIANSAGETPLSSAELFGHSETAETIRSAIMGRQKTKTIYENYLVFENQSPFNMESKRSALTQALQALPVLSEGALTRFRKPDPKYPDDILSRMDCNGIVNFLIDHLPHDAKITAKCFPSVHTMTVGCQYIWEGTPLLTALSVEFYRKFLDGRWTYLAHKICRASTNEYEIWCHPD